MNILNLSIKKIENNKIFFFRYVQEIKKIYFHFIQICCKLNEDSVHDKEIS